MKIIALAALLTLLSQAWAQDYKTSVILDPSISKRCKSLVAKRDEKVLHKQKLQALLKRNKRLHKFAPKERKSAISKLSDNQRELNQELRLARYRISNMEENIVRQGCPGLKL